MIRFAVFTVLGPLAGYFVFISLAGRLKGNAAGVAFGMLLPVAWIAGLAPASTTAAFDTTAGSPSLTDPTRYPNANNPASYRADSSAGTAGRCGAIDAPSARTGAVSETSAPAAASDWPCADCRASRGRPRFPRGSVRLFFAGSLGRTCDLLPPHTALTHTAP